MRLLQSQKLKRLKQEKRQLYRQLEQVKHLYRQELDRLARLQWGSLPVEEDIEQWLVKRSGFAPEDLARVSTRELWRAYVRRADLRHYRGVSQVRFNRVVRGLGFRIRQRRVDGRVVRVWVRV